jgi:hypothetical protein
MCVPPAAGAGPGSPHLGDSALHHGNNEAGFPAPTELGIRPLAVSNLAAPGQLPGAYLLGDGDGDCVAFGDALPLGAGVVAPILPSASMARCRAAASFFC